MDIYLDNQDSKHVKKIEKLIENELDFNPNFAGCEYTIHVNADYTYIDNVSEIDGSILLSKIHNLIENDMNNRFFLECFDKVNNQWSNSIGDYNDFDTLQEAIDVIPELESTMEQEEAIEWRIIFNDDVIWKS